MNLYLLSILPIAILIFFHFALAKIVVRKDKLQFLIILLSLSIIFGFCIPLLDTTDKLDAGKEVFFLPAIYLLNLVIFRYLLFNRITFKHKLHSSSYPFDPKIIFPGAIYLYWDNKKTIKPSILEYIFSVWILIIPFFVIALISNI